MDVFVNVHNKCVGIYELDAPCFFVNASISMVGTSEKKELKLELLTDANMLQMVENGTRVEMSHAIHPYGKTNNMLMRNSGTSKESSYLMYWNVNNVYGQAMQQNLPEDILNREKICLGSMKNSYRAIMKTVKRDTNLKSMLSNPRSHTIHIVV